MTVTIDVHPTNHVTYCKIQQRVDPGGAQESHGTVDYNSMSVYDTQWANGAIAQHFCLLDANKVLKDMWNKQVSSASGQAAYNQWLAYKKQQVDPLDAFITKHPHPNYSAIYAALTVIKPPPSPSGTQQSNAQTIGSKVLSWAENGARIGLGVGTTQAVAARVLTGWTLTTVDMCAITGAFGLVGAVAGAAAALAALWIKDGTLMKRLNLSAGVPTFQDKLRAYLRTQADNLKKQGKY